MAPASRSEILNETAPEGPLPMIWLTSLGLAATAAFTVAHDPHGCPEVPHDYRVPCRCERLPPYYYPRPFYYHPGDYPRRDYEVRGYERRDYVVRGRPVRRPSPPVYIEGPRIYVDAPPVYVEPAQIYVERPEIIVRPSEVIVAPPEVHFEPCPQGAQCVQEPATPPH